LSSGRPLLHAEREHLHREHVAVAVHHETGQLVGLAIDHAHGGLARVDGLAQALRALQALHEERGVHLVAAAGQEPRADQAVAIHVRPAQERTTVVHDVDDAAVLDAPLPRVHLVGEDPRVAAAHAAILAAAQDQPRERRRRGHRWLWSMWPIIR
jgi:hypothetical protein